MGRWLGRLLVLLVAIPTLGGAALVGAQQKAKDEGRTETQEAGQEAAEEVNERRSNHFRNRTKIRSGSMIRRHQDDPPPPDLRGEYERRRDHQVIRHFTRLAQLDAITKVALGAGDTALAARVETVRRAENERFRLAMDRLRMVIRHRLRTGMP